MAQNFINIATFLYILLPIWAFITVDSAAPAPAVDCSSLVLDMADCLSFVTAGSTTTKPEGSCCTGLKTVLKTDAECLCEGFRNSAQFGVTLNITKATSLPSACHVSAPSVSNCGLSTGTGVAPALPPMALAPIATAGSPTSSIGSSEITPAVAPISSSSAAFSIGSVALSLVAAASLSLF
ncbi:hypothetical protein Leryth_013144 [Lithospermum erythrorhizon]|nr:hypothetical protein Leryth_013144 [Lithospermum erythrorhizon]